MSNNFNKWSLGFLLHSPLCFLPVFFIPGSNALAANSDTIVVNGEESIIDNLTLANDANSVFIIQGKKGANITATHINLVSTGIRGGGAWIDNSKFSAQDLLVHVSGNSATGVYLANNSDAVLQNINVIAQGSARGLELDGTWSMAQGHSTAEVSDSTITSEMGNAIRVMAGDLVLNNVTASTTGQYSYAVNANFNAKVDIEGGQYSTQGLDSHGVWIPSADSSVTMNNAAVATEGNGAIAVNAQIGTAAITNSTLETQGTGAHGLYTENQIKGDGLSITTSGDNGAAVFTALGGSGVLTNSTIETHGKLAPGLLAYPGSEITADTVQVETTGKQGFGLWSRAGTLNVRNSQISTLGEEASGLYLNGYSSSSKINNSVSLDNVTLTSKLAQAIEVSTTEVTLNVNNSVLSGGNGLMTVNNINDPLDPANNVYSKVAFSAVNSTLNGDITVANQGNTVKVDLASGSVLNGAVNNATSLAVDATSRWELSNNSMVQQLTNNGTINFSDRSKFDTLTVSGDYAGDGGTLVMNGALGNDASPVNKLIVGGDVLQGNTNVAISNLGGHGAQTVEGIEIVDVGGTSIGSFTKTGRIVAGAYDYDLVKKQESWYLTSQQTASVTPPEDTAPPDDVIPPENIVPSDPPDNVSPPEDKHVPVVRPEGASYTANLAAANRMFLISLHDRLGETQYVDALTGQSEVTSLWLRQVGGHNVWRDGSGQLKTQSNRYVAQMGGDVARWSSNGLDRWHVGFMAGYGNDHSNTQNRSSGYHSKGSVDGYSIGGYATWYANSDNHTGGYLDSWLQYGWFNNDVNGEKQVTESYKSHGITASLEGGYTWKLGQFLGSLGSVNEWFIQPQAQMVWMGVRADHHQEANGTRIEGEGEGNLLTRLGIRTFLKGHHASDNKKQREFQPFIEFNWIHNTRSFATKMDDVRVSQNGARNLAEVKVGLEGQINPRLNLWGNIGVQMGDAGYNDGAVMLGVKYNF